MTEPVLTPYGVPARPDAVVLMLHGGTPTSRLPVDSRSASWRRSWWMARSMARGARAEGAGVWLLRYRERGWNGGIDRLADARWALDLLREQHNGVPAVLVGHSMGARVAVHVADHPSVVGVVGLAPWWSPQDPVRTLAGRRLTAAHGRGDRVTSYAQTEGYVARAERVADQVTMHDMGPLGHYMLHRSRAWDRVALDSALAMVRATQAG